MADIITTTQKWGEGARTNEKDEALGGRGKALGDGIHAVDNGGFEVDVEDAKHVDGVQHDPQGHQPPFPPLHLLLPPPPTDLTGSRRMAVSPGGSAPSQYPTSGHSLAFGEPVTLRRGKELGKLERQNNGIIPLLN